MDRPSPYYVDPLRGQLSRPSASRDDEQQDPRHRSSERLPPLLPTSHSLPLAAGSATTAARSEGLPPLSGSRLPPIKQSIPSPYASHRPYPPPPHHERPATFDHAPRRPSSPSSMPVGMVSADYMHARRSPGEVAPPYPSSSSSAPSSSYHHRPHHMHHADPYRQDGGVLRANAASTHVPQRFHYDAHPPHLGHHPHPSETAPEPISTGTPIKRPRVSLACLACRNRKSRCDGVRPTCKTCATMKIECKWPEVDFRRAKTGDAAKARKRSPPGVSAQQSPESLDTKHHGRFDAAAAAVVDDSYGRTSSGALLPASQSMPLATAPPPLAASQISSPTPSHGHRYRTHSDGDRQRQPLQASRSPTTERYMYPYPQERRPDPYARIEAYSRTYGPADPRDTRPDPAAAPRSLDDRAQPYPQDHHVAAWDRQVSRPIRALPEPRAPPHDPAAIRCRNRAAEIAILARPATDAQRIAVEAHMARESNLDDLADQATAGEHLDHAFSVDWDAIGGLAPAARRPFMDVAAGIVGILEISDLDAAQRSAARSTHETAAGRLHLFRLRPSASASSPDLRHLSIAMDLSMSERRELLETTSSPYNTLSYPISVDRLSRPLVEIVRTSALQDQIKAEPTPDARSGCFAGFLPAPSDSIPIVRKEDIKPSQAVLELFLQAYVRAIGDQMPGFDTKVIAARIQNGTISALLANALCAIGASLYERRGQRPTISEALSSKVYVERARALIGAALQTPDLEPILAFGAMAIRDILMGQMISAAVIVSAAVRLCMQLDLHRARPAHDAATGGSDDVRAKLAADDVFWMIYCLDRITSIATARPLAIKDQDIDTAFPATMRNDEPCIFAALVRQLHYLGRLADVAVTSTVGASASGVGAERERARDFEIANIGSDLVGHYESLPTVFRLSAANLERAHDKAEPLSFLQLHLTHNMALLHRFLLSRGGMTIAEFETMRSAAGEIVEVCRLGEALDATLLADTPLSAVACFLAGCVLVAEDEEDESSGGATQRERVRDQLAILTGTLTRHADFWPVARTLVDVLHAQQTRANASAVSQTTIAALVSNLEAVHILVRRAGLEDERSVRVSKVDDLEMLRGAFPHLC